MAGSLVVSTVVSQQGGSGLESQLRPFSVDFEFPPCTLVFFHSPKSCLLGELKMDEWILLTFQICFRYVFILHVECGIMYKEKPCKVARGSNNIFSHYNDTFSWPNEWKHFIKCINSIYKNHCYAGTRLQQCSSGQHACRCRNFTSRRRNKPVFHLEARIIQFIMYYIYNWKCIIKLLSRVLQAWILTWILTSF